MIEIDGRLIVVDCGNGVVRQLVAAGLNPRDAFDVLITHHHIDHNADVAYLPMISWVEGRSDPLSIYGPVRTIDSMDALLKGFAEDLENRAKSSGRPAFRPMLRVNDIADPGMLLDKAGVKISCAIVDHLPFDIALGYRIDSAEGSVVVSGDTAPSENLVRLARGADVLVHEVVHPDGVEPAARDTNARTIRAHLNRNHTLLGDVGGIAARAGVKRLVLSHIFPHEGIREEEWIAPVREHFDGEVILGVDLMQIEV